jgi:tetratricopeptide (TPR) repeat protein
MNRPTAHIIETHSQRIFQSKIPVEWVCQPLAQDYGIDYLIEVFKNRKSTGITFYVQLKGSEADIKNNTFKKQFERNTLEYYESLSLPVLIVTVSIKTGQIWGIWANNLINTHKIKPNQKSIKIKLGPKNLIESDFFDRIEHELKLQSRYGISLTADSQIGNLIAENIKNFINFYYPDSFEINNPYIPNHFCLTFLQQENTCYFSLSGQFFNEEIQFDHLEFQNPVLHRPVFDESEINNINVQILKQIVVAFSREDLSGSLNLLKCIIEKNYLNSIEEAKSLDLLGMLQSSISNCLVNKFNEITKLILHKGLYEIFLLLDIYYFFIGKKDDSLSKLRGSNLKLAINHTKNINFKGSCYYNLGNIGRSTFDNFEVFKYYLAARKHQPDYENRHYWWRELAGVLFMCGHFKFAELFYLKSIELIERPLTETTIRVEQIYPNQDTLTFALVGDCLFHQGKFKEAKSWFIKFFENHNDCDAEWCLKDLVSSHLIELGFDGIKRDYEKSNSHLDEALRSNDNHFIISELEKAININPLNAVAWFNLGTEYRNLNKTNEGLLCFLVVGLLQEGDKEAQFNALLLAFSTEDRTISQLLIKYIWEKHGSLVLNDLSDFLFSTDLEFECKKLIIDNLIEVLENIEQHFPEKTNHFRIRFPHQQQ